MKRILIILSSIILCVILLLKIFAAGRPDAKPADMLAIKGDIIKSTVNGKVYQLYVSLPANYNSSDSLHYPVLYVLDGSYAFPVIAGTRNVLDLGHEIGDLIIVAIGDSVHGGPDWISSRTLDYTPSYDAQSGPVSAKGSWLPQGSRKSGGAKAFLTTLREDIIPFIDKHYKTTADRGITGHSLGGLFAGYCLLTAPDLFTRYGINSPSFWWNDNEILALEDSFIKGHSQLHAKVFLSVGSLEPEIMVTDMTAFASSLKKTNYKDLILSTQIFDNETHLSAIPVSLTRTLRVLYGSRSR